MLSDEVKQLYDSGKVSEVYKYAKKYIDLIDFWADKLIHELLDENELSFCMQQMTGCFSKLNPIAGAFEAMYEEYVSNYQIVEEATFTTSVRVQDQNTAKAKARGKAGDISRYASDFLRYTYAAQTSITTAQSRLKRFSLDKGNQGVGASGDMSNTKQSSSAKEKLPETTITSVQKPGW